MSNPLADESWRLNNLYYIKDVTGNKVLFRPNWAQLLLYRAMWYLNIILKARQLGLTTFIQIFMLDRCLFNDNTNAGIVAQTREDAEAFFADKIKFAYDNLPVEIRQAVSARSDNARELSFSNGSKIRVGVSLRSGTYQYVHISEFGKISAQDPAKAKEIITGTLNTVAPGQFIFIESTAEGSDGPFHDMCKRAMELQHNGATLTKMDYKFWFFPWYKHPKYELPGVTLHLSDEEREYFEQLEAEEGITLSNARKAWYVKKWAEQQDEMKSEFPATPQEAFQKLLKGAIFASQLRKARSDMRICKLPHVRGVPVNTFWDIGRNDLNSIWFHQRVGSWDHFIHYYENRLVDFTHYTTYIFEMARENQWNLGVHHLPHDGNNTDYTAYQNKSRRDLIEDTGLKPVVVVAREPSKINSIEIARRAFSQSRFDQEGCSTGIQCLENYVWTWDKTHEVFRKTPLHNSASNGADAYQTFGLGYKGPVNSLAAQLAKLDNTGGREYLRGKARNPLTNPSTDHIT